MGYDYQIGIVRAKESNLLKKSDWDRIIGFISLRDTWAELVRINLGYKEVHDSEIVNNISKAYSNILTNHYKEITEYFIEVELKKSFLYEFDLFNLKLLYKQKVFPDLNFESNLMNAGCFQSQDLLDYLQDGKSINNFENAETDSFFADILKILKDEKTELSPLEFDVLLDNYLFDFKIEVAKKLKSDFLLDFWKIQIDFYNLKFLKQGVNEDFNFVKNGFIEVENWQKIMEESVDGKIKLLAKYGYKNVTEKAFLAEDTNTADWELAEENYILEFCEKAVAFSATCEPIIAYFYRRYCEIKNLNRILCNRAFRMNNATMEQQISKSWIF